ncbi:uncharacterized protein LOC112906329 [Agrilus planipennis]|uniref:Uncharacterized protein LOC112906077 n=1 Tax=Agrilus planipennis TaxID=224129 RepID=A0A7F5RJK2_AGRPL|nr:uncharacterized protein LOC112906077 [Agrilus planipennis]XP_025836040.1 uncharacterized protein LOC112906329 [Agrilus planipennis]
MKMLIVAFFCSMVSIAVDGALVKGATLSSTVIRPDGSGVSSSADSGSVGGPVVKGSTLSSTVIRPDGSGVSSFADSGSVGVPASLSSHIIPATAVAPLPLAYAAPAVYAHGWNDY